MKLSIIIPTKTLNKTLLTETIPAIENQTHSDWELIIVPDTKPAKKSQLPKSIKVHPHLGSPAEKRDFAAKLATGQALAFLDSDAYPDKNWLKQAAQKLSDPTLAAVCGPNLTPRTDSEKAQISGYIWQCRLGAGGAGTYRNRISHKRFVDDYPSSNLIIRTSAFKAVGGFNSNYWPGEDTKLCHDLVHKLDKKILYHPSITVYHHRRPIYKSHLEQITRFGLQRGAFVRLLPKTSRRPGYFTPLAFTFSLLIIPVIFTTLYTSNFPRLAFLTLSVWLLSLTLYLLALIVTSLNAYQKTKTPTLALHLIPAIFLTHFTYGGFFLVGLLLPQLVSTTDSPAD